MVTKPAEKVTELLQISDFGYNFVIYVDFSTAPCYNIGRKKKISKKY